MLLHYIEEQRGPGPVLGQALAPGPPSVSILCIHMCPCVSIYIRIQYIYIYIYIYILVHIKIYIQRERYIHIDISVCIYRKRDRERERSIQIYPCIHIYIYIYRDIQACCPYNPDLMQPRSLFPLFWKVSGAIYVWRDLRPRLGRTAAGEQRNKTQNVHALLFHPQGSLGLPWDIQRIYTEYSEYSDSCQPARPKSIKIQFGLRKPSQEIFGAIFSRDILAFQGACIWTGAQAWGKAGRQDIVKQGMLILGAYLCGYSLSLSL